MSPRNLKLTQKTSGRNETNEKSAQTTKLSEKTKTSITSPEKLIVLSDVLGNMKLAHEIAVDPEFKLSPQQGRRSSLYARVAENVRGAFWASHAAKLNQTPPDYTPLVRLMVEAKLCIEAMLPERAERYRAALNESLDIELMKQQIETGCLDLPRYFGYVAKVLGELCSPYRDREVKLLKRIDTPVPFFEKMFEILDLMKLDMLNFTIQEIKPFIQSQSCMYERKKFAEYLKLLEVLPLNGVTPDTAKDGLIDTKRWLIAGNNILVKNNSEARDYRYEKRWTAVIKRCLVLLLEYSTTPETFVLDEQRLTNIRDRKQWILSVATMLNVAMASPLASKKVESMDRQHGGNENTTRLRHAITCSLEKIVSPKELRASPRESGLRIMEQICVELEVTGVTANASRLAMLRRELEGTVNDGKEHGIYELLDSRLDTFLIESLPDKPPEMLNENIGIASRGVTAEPEICLQVPAGLSGMLGPVTLFVQSFMLLVNHNRSVHDPIYEELYNGYILGGKLLETLYVDSNAAETKKVAPKKNLPFSMKMSKLESVRIGDQVGNKKAKKNKLDSGKDKLVRTIKTKSSPKQSVDENPQNTSKQN